MNNNSYTYDIDDWEIVSDKPNNIEYRYIENTFIENIYNENWYSDINNKLLTLNLDNNQLINKEVWENKNIKDIIENAKKGWNKKIQNDKVQNKFTKKRKIS